jgi:hypothetical protein
LGYIKEFPLSQPFPQGEKGASFPLPWGERLREGDYCLDTNCFRKEINFDKTDKEYFSRIAD